VLPFFIFIFLYSTDSFMKAPYPSVSTRGFITDPLKAVDQALADFFVTNYSQSVVFHGSLRSAVYELQKAGSDDVALTAGMREALQTMLGHYFDDVSVIAKISPNIDVSKQNTFDLIIAITFTSNTIKYDVTSVADIDRSQMKVIQREMEGN
jgi:hypothetical protein